MTSQFTNFVNLRELPDMTMNEKSLIKLCMVVSIIGLVIIYIMEFASSADTTAIGSITKDNAGESVKVCGTISKMYVSNKENIFFNLNDSASISVVVFRDKAELFDAGSMKNGMRACVDGNVQIYNDKLEIIAGRLALDSRE